MFTRGTVERLLPFALSLVRASDVGVRLVANACHDHEIALLAGSAQSEPSVAYHVLPASSPLDHGRALNLLFETFREPHFAIADSDVIATGDFMSGIWPLPAGQAATSAGAALWMPGEDGIAPSESILLGGRQDRLPDGRPLGSTHLAIYNRAATEPAWRRAPNGFELHRRPSYPPEVREALAAWGWDYEMLDTGRMVNLLLMLDGWELGTHPGPEIHHVGGISLARTRTRGRGLRRLARVVRSDEGRRLGRLAEGVRREFLFRRLRRELGHRGIIQSRQTALAHVNDTIDALRAGGPVPPVPATGSEEVDERLRELTAVLEAHYRPAL